MSGPKKTPAAELKRRGSRKAAEREKTEPKASGNAKPPKWVSPGGLLIWKQVEPLLAKSDVTRAVDANALGRYCENHYLWIRARELVEVQGITTSYEDKNGQLITRPSAALRAMKALNEELVKADKAFGLTPADRAGLTVVKTEDPESADVREIEMLLGGKTG